MSVEEHMNESRSFVNSLSQLSEDSKYEDTNNFKTSVNDNWGEAVTQWKAVISHPRYYPYQTSFVIKRKSKPVDSRVPDWQRTSYAEGDAKQVVRCINDELSNGPYLHWKGMVEQVTYRYVPHNGYYRTMKFLNLDKREWFTVNKKQPEQVSMSWQSKRYQKELKRQLKKDFENQNRKENERYSLKHQGLDLQTEQSELEIPNRKETQVDRPRHRSKSSKLKSPDVSKRCQLDDEGFLVPEIKSAPLPGDLFLHKSRSDLYIENISMRISALEQEIENDTRLRNKQEDSARTLYRPKGKERERDTTPRPYKKESLPDDVFTAKRIGSREVKPPEKLNPVSRISTADSKSAQVTHLKYTTSSGNDPANVNLPTIDLEKTLNSYKLAIENTRHSLLTTLNGKQIGRRTITSKNYNSPTTITICDNGEGGEKNALHDFIRPVKGDKRVQTRKELKELTSVAPLLPEIAGKRLEVPTTSHRWL